MKIIDAHTHINKRNIESGFASLFAMAKQLNYDRLSVLSLQCGGDLLQNLTCALCKYLRPEMIYAFGGLDYITGRDFVSQAENLRAMGYDGIKMLEGKPTTRKLLKRALDEPAYDDFFSYLEECKFPVLLHIADPGTFWDRERAPDWAVERGWLYDETHVPYAQYYDEVDRMLAKHPNLRAIFAHFYFLSDNPVRAQRFLDEHPNVSIDVTAGIEMYEDFAKDPAFWREFFIKNENRIIFGTDSNDEPSQGGDKVELNSYGAMEIDFLRYDKDITVYDKQLHGLGLPNETLEKIFSLNYLKYVGEPQLLDIAAIIKEADYIRSFLKNDSDKEKLELLVSKLKK